MLLTLFLSICPLALASVAQIHMAQGRDPSSMVISWQTAEPSSSYVRYGLTSDDLSLSSTGNETSYEFEYPPLPYYTSGTFHHVELTNLTSFTTYYYQCGDETYENSSRVLSFVTMPAVGDPRSFSVAVVGDLGQTQWSESTVEHMLRDTSLGLILHAGDLSYADCNQDRWDSYADMVEPLSSSRPWMFTAGNHELENNAASGATTTAQRFLAFESRYRMPAVKPVEYGEVILYGDGCTDSNFQMEYNYGNSFYSIEFGSMHALFLNCYTPSNISASPQYDWASSDLDAVDREATPWVVALVHCPPYNSNSAHAGESNTVTFKANMETLLYKHHVNMVINGHVHAYERTWPVVYDIPTCAAVDSGDDTVDDGIVYAVIGDGGNNEGHSSNYIEPAPAWSAFRNGTQYGHGSLTVHNNTHMTWTWHRNEDGEIISRDSYTLCNVAMGMPANCGVSC